MSTFFKALGKLQPHVWHDDECERAEGALLRQGAQLSDPLEAALDGPNIPVSVYTRLVDGVNKNLPAFHRYLKLRKRMMGVDQLHYYDLYAPLVASVESDLHARGGGEAVLAAVAPLGPDYVAVVQRAFNDRWIDLLSDRREALRRVFEWRRLRRAPVHADQLSRQVRRRQHAGPRVGPHDAQLLLEQDAAVSDGELSDLRRGGRVDVQRGAAHRLHAQADQGRSRPGCPCSATTWRTSRARCSGRRSSRSSSCGCTRWREKGEPLTGDALAKLYMDITKRYYGHDKGVCIVDDYVAHEWSFIPHFYRNFYVFQYATSFTASAALSEKVLAGDEAAKKLPDVPRRRRIEIPDRPAEGRRRADMTTDEPLDLTIKKMNRVMDEMEALLAKMPARPTPRTVARLRRR